MLLRHPNCLNSLTSSLLTRFRHATTLVHPTTPHSKYNDFHHSKLFQLLSEQKLNQARQLLNGMPKKPSNIITWTSTLNQYAKLGFIREARALFDVMPERNVVTWNSMLGAYVRLGNMVEANWVFGTMPERNVVSYTSMLCGLMCSGRVGEAKNLFDVMPERNVVSFNAMISGLVRNGELDEARKVFDVMSDRNVVSWNAMISGYVESLRIVEARRLFDEMDCDPNVVTWTSLISGYCRVGDVSEADSLFDKMPEKNVVSWTAMIGGFVWNCYYKEALQRFCMMQEFGEVKPNEETFISLFYACAGLVFDRLGKQIHGYMIVNGMALDDHDEKLLKSLIYMYSRFGIMDTSRFLFDKLRKCDSILLNCMINGYVQAGMLGKARELFDQALFLDEKSWTSIIAGYFNEGRVEEAMLLFAQMPLRDAVSWTVVISGHVQNELFSEAIKLYNEMQVLGVAAVEHTYSSLLGATGAMACLQLGQQFHCQALKSLGTFDTVVCNSLISMYAKSGALDEAFQIFNTTTNCDIVTWNSMIVGLSHHGRASEALQLLQRMKSTGTRPNSVTFLAILSACSHNGLISEGWDIFNSMTREYSISPDVGHQVCMVDLLGRAGRITEAEDFVKKLPFQQEPAIWGALLSACGIGDKNVLVARYAAQKILELDPYNAPAHALLCNIYAANGERKEEEMLRKAMGVNGVKKFPGCSWILLKGQVHVFLSGDTSHPEINEISSLLLWIIENTKASFGEKGICMKQTDDLK